MGMGLWDVVVVVVELLLERERQTSVASGFAFAVALSQLWESLDWREWGAARSWKAY